MSGQTRCAFVLFLIGVAFSSLSSNSTWADRLETALLESRSEGRPLLAIASSDHCEPCRKMHARLKSSELRNVVEKCVVLKMQSQSEEFARFVHRYPADARIIPMIYVILPNGSPMYAQSGLLESTEIDSLLREAIRYSQTMKSAEVDEVYRRLLEAAKGKAKSSQLIDALRITSSIADEPGDSRHLEAARDYQARLIEAVAQWIQDLDKQMGSAAEAHGAAFRIAQIFVELPDHKSLHQSAGRLLLHYDKQPETHLVVAQAKYLLKARYREDENRCEQAISNYQHVVDLDESSPAGRYAARQLVKLRRQQAGKLTASISAGG